MADEMKQAKAKEVYDSLCELLDEMELHYTKDDEDAYDGDLVLRFTMAGDDLPMRFIFVIDPDRQLIRVMSPLPFTTSEEKRLDMAIAVCVASRGLPDGSFDYDISDGTVTFRQTVSFRESKIGKALFLYLLHWSNSTVDRYNDRLFAVSKGLMSLEDFIAAE